MKNIIILLISVIFCQISLATPSQEMLDRLDALADARIAYLTNVKETLTDPDNSDDEKIEYISTYLFGGKRFPERSLVEAIEHITVQINDKILDYTVLKILIQNIKLDSDLVNYNLIKLHIYLHILKQVNIQLENSTTSSQAEFNESRFITPSLLNELMDKLPDAFSMANFLEMYFGVQTRRDDVSGGVLKQSIFTSTPIFSMVNRDKVKKTIANVQNRFGEILAHRARLSEQQQRIFDTNFEMTTDELFELRAKITPFMEDPDRYFNGVYIIGGDNQREVSESEGVQILLENFELRYSAVYHLVRYKLALDAAHKEMVLQARPTKIASASAAASAKKTPKKAKHQKKTKPKKKEVPVACEEVSGSSIPASVGSCSSSTATLELPVALPIDDEKEEEQIQDDEVDEVIEENVGGSEIIAPALEQHLLDPQVWRKEDFYDLLKIWRKTLHAQFFVNGKPWIPKRNEEGGFTVEIKYRSAVGKPALMFCHTPHGGQNKNRKIWTGWRGLMRESLQKAGYLVR